MAGKAFKPRDYYEARGMTTKEFVTRMRETYPKFSFTANSLCNHPEQTGVTLTNAARSEFKAPRREMRKKPCRYSVRLSEADSERFEKLLSDTGRTAQSLIEAIILRELELYDA